MSIEYISERLIKISIREGNEIIKYIQIYAPCNDKLTEEKADTFYGKLSDTIDSIPDYEDLYVMDDFNGRVGERRTPWTDILAHTVILKHHATNKTTMAQPHLGSVCRA